MSREIDERKKRKALRKLRKAAMLAEQGLGPELSDWEKQFLEEVEERIETYGSAFNDPEKGGKDEPLSALQNLKLREIDKKARGKGKSGFKSKKKPAFTPRVRQLNDDVELSKDKPQRLKRPKPSGPRLVKASELKTVEEQRSEVPPPQSERPKGRPVFKVIEGGAAKD